MKPTRGLAVPTILGILLGFILGLLLVRTPDPPTAGERAIGSAMSSRQESGWGEVGRLLRINAALKAENARLRLEARR